MDGVSQRILLLYRFSITVRTSVVSHIIVDNETLTPTMTMDIHPRRLKKGVSKKLYRFFDVQDHYSGLRNRITFTLSTKTTETRKVTSPYQE